MKGYLLYFGVNNINGVIRRVSLVSIMVSCWERQFVPRDWEGGSVVWLKTLTAVLENTSWVLITQMVAHN